MKKTTPYARKMRQRGRPIGIVNAASWHNAIERCQPLSETAPIVQGVKRATDAAALLIEAREALDDMLHHRIEPSNPKPYDCLASTIDVAFLRSIEIDGNPQTNPMHADLVTARAVLHSIRTRWERIKRWGLYGQEREPLARSVDHYEVILLASSSEQMHAAEVARCDAIAKGCFFEPAQAGNTTDEPRPGVGSI